MAKEVRIASLLVITGLLLTAAIAERTYAQAKPGTGTKPAASAAKTTLSGIYTAAQASKGEDIYFALCVTCHAKGTYAGPSFKTNWNNRPLWDLWDWISNKMPAGSTPLPPNEKTLYGIKIQIK